MKSAKLFILGLLALPALLFAQNIGTLDQLTSTTTPGSASITQRTIGKPFYLTGFTDGCLYLLGGVLTSNSSNATCTGGGGGGGTETNWNFFNGSGIRLGTSTNQVLISATGATATTSRAKLEVHQDSAAFGAFLVNGSSTLLNFTATNSTTTNATTTAFAISSLASSLVTTNTAGSLANYGGSTCGANTKATSISAAGAVTCSNVANTDLANSSITINTLGGLISDATVSLGGTLNISAKVSTSSVPTIGQVAYWTGNGTPSNLGSVGTSSLLQSTGINIANGTAAYVIGSQPTFTVDQAFTPTWTGAHIFNNITRSTTTSATSTNLFATTASTTNFFGAGLTTCQAGNVLTYNGAGNFGCAADATSAAGSPNSKWATSTDTLFIYPNGGTTNVVIGSSAMATMNALLGLRATTTTGNLINASSTTGFAGNFLRFNGASNNELFRIDSTGALQTTASTTLQNFTGLNSTTTNATSTNFFATTASTTNFFGADLLSSCNGTGNKLTYTTGGKFLCEADQNSGGGGGGNSKFATSSDTLFIYPSGLTTNLVVGGSGMSSMNALLGLKATTTTGNLINASSTTGFAGNFLRFNGASNNELLRIDSTGAFQTTASTTLQNFTGLQATTTNATSTNFFATTASTSNLFFTTATGGGLTLAVPLAAGSGGTGLSALGANVATWLGTPSSANFASAVTGETGTGAVVFDTTPTFTTSALFPLGSVGAPGIAFTGDTNNGFWSPAADITALSTVGIEAWRTDSAQRFGLGTTTLTWTLTVASSSPYFELDDTNGAANQKHLVQFYNGGIFGIATSSDTNFFATSSAFMSLDTTQPFFMGFGTTSVTTGLTADTYNVATSAVRIDSSATTKGGCIVLKDADGVGYTYVYGNNGTLFASTVSCL